MNKVVAEIILHFNRKPNKWFLKCAATKNIATKEAAWFTSAVTLVMLVPC
jgi:hypothetical protein